MGRRELSIERRDLGAYYTPRSVADLMSAWAIREVGDRVLEPSFGGCEFISSAKKRLVELGANEPLRNVYGADIDPTAFESLAQRHPDAPPANFRKGDFLGTDSKDFGGLVDVVIGNPPYVRHHAISEEVFAQAASLQIPKGNRISMRSNLWAHFVDHALSFLRVGGRMAWVLPQNYFYASYAQPIRWFLERHFSAVWEIEVKEHLFESEGASEKSVLVFCEGWHNGQSQSWGSKRIYAEDLRDIPPLLEIQTNADPELENGEALLSAASSASLGSLFDVKIGTVLGDARFFVFNRERAERLNIDRKHLQLVATGASAVRGLAVTQSDLASAYDRGEKVAVLNTLEGTDSNVDRLLSTMSVEAISRNATFGKRAVWHQPFTTGGKVPDAFFTGMSHTCPKLSLNLGKFAATNSLYELLLRGPATTTDFQRIALSMVSSYGQLSAELRGRPYGSGLLKHEPSDVRRIDILTLENDQKDVQTAFVAADQEMRIGNLSAARTIADRFFIGAGAYDPVHCEKMQGQTEKWRARRLKRNLKNVDKF